MRPKDMLVEEVAQVQEDQWGRAGRGGALRSGTCSAPEPNARGCDTKSRVDGMHLCTYGGNIKPRIREQNLVHLKATLKPVGTHAAQTPTPRAAHGTGGQ